MNCFYCDAVIANKYEHTYDHINPLSKGGKDKFENLVDCCYRCNELKADKPLSEFYELIISCLNTIGKNADQYAYYANIEARLRVFVG